VRLIFAKTDKRGGGITKNLHNKQTHTITATAIFKQAMSYRRRDRGPSFEPKNKPTTGLNDLQKCQKQEENCIVA